VIETGIGSLVIVTISNPITGCHHHLIKEVSLNGHRDGKTLRRGGLAIQKIALPMVIVLK
jgi:hypothetical protein